MGISLASRNVFAVAFLVGIGSGCGSTNGCASLKPLPTGLTPFGVPNSQVIEGGMQARLTEPGMKKFSTVIENQLSSGLAMSTHCLIPQNKLVGSVGNKLGWLVLCPDTPAACNAPACGASVLFDSAQRPAPWNIQDGVDKVDFSMADGTNPVVNVEASFDLDVPVVVDYGLPLGSEHKCTIEAYTAHYKGDATKKTFHFTAPIQLGIDPATGKLTLTTGALQIQSIGLQIQFNNCISSTLDTLLSSALDSVFNALDGQIGNFLVNLGAALLQPQIDAFVQSLLPHPPGLAGTLDTTVALASFSPPAGAGLETYLVPGGYVAAKDRGLTLGVLAGMNSDYDPTTRDQGNASEPNPCVPSRATPDLSAAPWSLPANTIRKDFTLDAAASFAGMPDPIDPVTGQVRDLLIGISRTYFDLIGFHLYNSGTLCLHVDGTSIQKLSTGTVGLLAPSLADIALDPKAPLQLVLRPQTPVAFTLGAGTATDALMHVAINDLRIDMYTWVEERWVRILTLGLDLNLGLNLGVTKDANMLPVLQPMLTAVDAQSLTVRLTNTDLLAETPAALEPLMTSLVSLAASSIAGSLPTVSLPSVAGFSLDDMSVQKVQSGQDDFLGLFATIKTPAATAPLMDWSDPEHPRLAGEVRTKVAITKLTVPPPDQLRALFDPKERAIPARPELTLALSAEGANGRPLEYGWKVDGGIWHLWSQNANPMIDDDAFLLQGHHNITVRARAVGDYRSEDSVPVTLPLLIDSVPPELKPELDSQNSNHLKLGGFDLVSDNDHLQYSWLDENGTPAPFTKVDFLDIATIGRITHAGQRRLVLSVKDEADFIGTLSIDATPYGHGTWGTVIPKGAGCGCELGGASGSDRASVLLLIGFIAMLLRRRRRQSVTPLIATVLVAVLGIGLVGCGCDNKDQQCKVNDDCVLMQCDVGNIPVCNTNQCGCTADITKGNTGRYASMVTIGTNVYVAAYNETYGDLMVGSLMPPGRVTNWEFVDGIPDEAPGTMGSHVRGGISTPGPDVGKYTSITRTPSNEPIIAYHDQSNGALKFASFGAIRWHSHTVDVGMGAPEGGGDDLGSWTSLTVDADGKPGIAYSAVVHTNTTSGKPEGQLRFAQANTVDPKAPTDWTITVVDSRPLPEAVAGEEPLLVKSIAIMVASARKSTGTLGIAYYDRERGNLRYAEQASDGTWTRSILDGEAANGMDTADVGQYPSIAYDSGDVAYIAYVDASQDNLLFVDTKDKTPAVVDDGYRSMEEMTNDGIASPVFHLVGDSSSIQIAHGQVVIAYQDSTNVELRLALRGQHNKWSTQKVAGHDSPFKGSYGFWAGAQAASTGAYVGSYAINQQVTPAQYYVEVFFVDLGIQL